MASIHQEPHPLISKKVLIVSGTFRNLVAEIIDWWDRYSGLTWKEDLAKRNSFCIMYAMRVRGENLPEDDEVIVVNVSGSTFLVHSSQLATEESEVV